jgi:hypothetical protein
MLCAYEHPDQEAPSKNSIIFTLNFIYFLLQKNLAAQLDIATASYGSALTG